jgi:hypothetical protein
MLQQRGLSRDDLDEEGNDEDADADAPRRYGNLRVMGNDTASESTLDLVPLHVAQADLTAKAGVILVRCHLLCFCNIH